MTSSYPLQQTFEVGLVSPRLQGKSQSSFYKAALGECENWLIKPQGSLRLRNGSRYLREAADVSSRLFNFSRANRDDVMVEVSNLNVNLIDKSGNIIIQGNTDNNVIGDPNYLQDWKVWSFSQDLTTIPSNNERFYTPQIQPNQNIIATVGQTIFAGNAGAERRRQTIFQNFFIIDASQDQVIKIDTTLTNQGIAGSATATATVRIKDQDGLEVFSQSQIISAGDPFKQLFSIDDTWTPSAGNFEYTIELELIQSGISYPNQCFAEWGKVTVLQVGGVNTPATFSTPWPLGIDVQKIQVATDTAQRRMYLVHPLIRPQEIVESQAGVFALQELQFGDDDDQKPAEWSDTPEPNWPSVPEVFQGRLWLANTSLSPSTIWASKVGDFSDFTIPTSGNQADEPLEFTLQTNGVINWLRGNKALLIATDTSEWIATSQTGVITNSDFNFTEQSRLGSAAFIAPQYVSDQIAYIGLDSRRVRVINFDADKTDTWASEEVSLQIDGFLSDRIVDMAYARDPDYQLACVTGAGELFICMHDRITKLNGWYQYTTTGQYRNIEYSNDPTGSSLWVITERTDINGDPKRYIEKFDAGEEIEAHLDSYIIQEVEVENQNGVGAFSSGFNSGFDGYGINHAFLSNLDRYSGFKIGCALRITTLDEDLKLKTTVYPHPEIYVDTVTNRATINLPFTDYYKAEAIVGYTYKARAVTLPLEEGNPAGTGQGTKRHFNRIFARVINDSAYPILNGYRPVPENPNIIDVLATLIDNDIEVRNEGTLERGIITIEQDLPIKTEIASVFGKSVSKVT